MKILDLFRQMESLEASDLFATAGKLPYMRIMGAIQSVSNEVLAQEDFLHFFNEHLPPSTLVRLQQERSKFNKTLMLLVS